MKYPLNIRGKNLLSIAVMFIVSIALVGAAMWSMAILRVPAGQAQYTPHPAPALWMDPNSTVNLNESDTFSVSIVVNTTGGGAGNNMYLWEYRLYWNTTWLSLVDCTPVITAKPDVYLGWGNNIAFINNVISAGEHWYAVSAQAPASGYVGVHWLCNYTFQVENQPYEPEPDYTGNFDFHLEAISDEDLNDIVEAGDWVIGTFEVLSVPLPPPELAVKPAKVHGVYGENFNITITIDYLTEGKNMCRWNATLSYDTTMLDAEASFEGPFLPGFGSTSYTYVIDDTAGTVYTTGYFVGVPVPPPSGSGVLAFIEFNATWQYTVSSTSLPPVTSSLSLYNTTLVNCEDVTIPVNPSVNATYYAPYKPEVIDHPITHLGVIYHVFTESNSSVSPVPMILNPLNKSLSFNATGKSGYYGYCKVTIPYNFLHANPPLDPWLVQVNGLSPLDLDYTTNATHTVLYFTFQFPSTVDVWVEGTWLVPEFPIAMILPLLLIATSTAVILGKKVRSGKSRGSSIAE